MPLHRPSCPSDFTLSGAYEWGAPAVVEPYPIPSLQEGHSGTSFAFMTKVLRKVYKAGDIMSLKGYVRVKDGK